MNLRQPSDPILAVQLEGCWPIALQFPRIPVVSEARGFSMKSGPWSPSELRLLDEAWPTWKHSADIARSLNRSVHTVSKMAWRRGLHRP